MMSITPKLSSDWQTCLSEDRLLEDDDVDEDDKDRLDLASRDPLLGFSSSPNSSSSPSSSILLCKVEDEEECREVLGLDRWKPSVLL